MSAVRKYFAFTLVELLVVITIIVILIAMLVPGLEKSFEIANRAKCLSNLKAIGTAVATSLNDSPSRQYPTAWAGWWWRMLGNLGTEYADPNFYDVPNRPLNKYLGFTAKGGLVPAAECPSDRGDFGSAPLYQRFGCSYLTSTNSNMAGTATAHFGIGNVFGGDGAPILAGNVNPTHNKVIFVDGPVFPNRLLSTRGHRWHHNSLTERKLNAVFADGHAEWFLFEFPQELEANPNVQSSYDYKENPSWKFW